MDSDDAKNDSGRNLMHQTNDESRIRKIHKVTQHDPYLENADEGDDEDHFEAPHSSILSVNVAKNNYRILQRKNVLEGHTRSWPHSSFAPFDSNCSKQQIISNFCDKLDLQTLERGQKLYTYPRGITINLMLLVVQLIWIVTPGKEEKSNTYTYYKRAKEQSTPGGHYHQILFFRFCNETNIDRENCLFCVIQSSTSNNVSFNIFLNARDNGVFSIGSLIDILNTDPIEDYMNGFPIIVSDEQSILMVPINHSPITMRNDL